MIKYEKGSLGYYIELAKKDGFDNIKDWNEWRRKNGKLKSHKKIRDEWAQEKGFKNRKEYLDRLAQERGFKDHNDYQESYRFENFDKLSHHWSKENKNKLAVQKGYNDYSEYLDELAKRKGYDNYNEYCRVKSWHNGHSPMSENEYCSDYFGIHIAERYISSLFEDPIRMPVKNPGFDWICKNGKKIQNKARCLKYDNRNDSVGWSFKIDYNDNTDYFTLSGWDDRNDLEPIFILLIHKNDIVRGKEFWNRETFWITNKPEHLLEFKKYELTDKLEKLRECCDKFKECS